jgi:CheY-like chemotaxis protein
LGANDPNLETVTQIEKSADRAASLTSQLLAFSRKQVFKPKLLSLTAVIEDMTHLLQRLIGENIHLITRPGVALGCIRADPGQIEQVILNLALNARDAMPQGGVLQITAENVDLEDRLDGFSTEFIPGPSVLLTVSDTGCGMTPDQKSHLFEPFFTTKETGKGTGLGLSIVYGVVKQSGGEIVCSSELGSGSTFQIYLPRIDAPPDSPTPPPRAPDQTENGETILLVEDGEIVRAMLTEVLQAQGYAVLQAVDGAEAARIAAAHSGRIDLLITDLIMPKLGGRNLADLLLVSCPKLRVLFISGYTDDEVIRGGRTSAASDFLQKPFRPEVLLSKVRQMLDSNVKK